MPITESQSRLERPRPCVYHGALLHALSADDIAFLPDGGLLVDADGLITACDHWEASAFQRAIQRVPELETVRLPVGTLLIPGLVDLHVHLPQMAVTGCQAPTLLSWLEQFVFPEEGRFSDPAYAAQISDWFFQELLRNGTTTAAIFPTSHVDATDIAFQAAERWGNRIVMGLTLMDLHAPTTLIRPAQQLLLESEQLCRKWHGKDQGRLQYAWTLRFALTSSVDLLAGLGALRRQYPSVYFQTHLAEQGEEVAAVLRQFPDCANYTDVYARHGLFGSRTLLAHGIHLSEEERLRIHASDATLAHCPSSNFFLKSGRFPLAEARRHGIRLGLASDVGAGPELSLFKVMKDAQYMQPDELVSVRYLFYLATLGGAEGLHLADRIGNFTPGKEADFVLLDFRAKPGFTSPADNEADWAATMSDADRLLSRLIYLADDRIVKAVYIRGERRYPPEAPNTNSS